MANATTTVRPRPRRRWRRRLGRLAIAFAAVLLGVAIFRDSLITILLEDELHRRTGAEVAVEDLDVRGLRSVRVGSIVIDAPGWRGDAARVLRIDDLSATIHLLPLLSGTVEFESIRAERVQVRVAERADDAAAFNFMALEPPDEDRKDDEEDDRDRDRTVRGLGLGTIEIARLEIESGIEVEDPAGGHFELVGTSSFNAILDPPNDADPRMAFTLAAIDAGETTALAKGHLDERTGRVEFRIDDVDLQLGVDLALSASARAFVSELDLGGVLRTANVEWQPGEDPSATLEVENLTLTLPEGLDLESEWVRFADGRILDETPPLPRITLDAGRIDLDGRNLLVRGSRGRMVPGDRGEAIVPVDISTEIRVRLETADDETDDQPIATWGMRLLEEAPFRIELSLSDFKSDGDEDVGADLPRPVAEALELLTARAWNLTATATVARGSLEPGSAIEGDEPIEASADLWLTGGRGMYEQFRYPLEEVDAQLTVDGERIRIVSLSGLGPDDDRLRLTGEILGTGDDAAVDLELQSDRIGLDEHLLQALPDSTERGLRALFDQTAFERLDAAGLLVDQARVDTARKNLADARTARFEALERGDRRAAERLERRIDRCESLIAAGPFALGGHGGMRLRIHRPRGIGIPVAVEGDIHLDHVGAIFDRFPYPLVATEGTIRLEDLAVVLEPPGLSLITPAGGRGRISGRIDLPRDGRGSRDVLPDLRLTVTNDPLNSTLLAAIPPRVGGGRTPAEIPGWPGVVRSDAVEPIVEMGLAGDLDYHGRIGSAPDGSTFIDFTILLEHGSASPGRNVAADVPDVELIWPRGFELDEISAVLSVTDELVELRSFSGRRGPGTVLASGRYEIERRIGTGSARLQKLEIEPYLLGFVPAGSTAGATRLWNEWRPTGGFDARIEWEEREGTSTITTDATPRTIEIDTRIGRTVLDFDRGGVRFRDDVVFVDDVAMRSETDDVIDGVLRIDGGYGLAPEAGDQDLRGLVESGRFESPALDEILRLAVGEGFAEWWRARRPEGGFHGRFDIGSGRERSLEAELEPMDFTILATPEAEETRGGGRVRTGGMVRIDDEQVRIGPLELTSDRATTCRFTFSITDFDAPRIEGGFRLDAPDSRVPEIGFLTPPFSSVVGPSTMTTGTIRIGGEIEARYGAEGDLGSESDGSMQDDPIHYRASGAMQFADGAWTVGNVGLTGIEGSLRLGLVADRGRATAFDLEARLPNLLVEGRPVEDVALVGVLDPANPRDAEDGVLVDITEASMGGGVVRGRFRFDLEGEAYRLGLQLHDADLAHVARDVGAPGPPAGPLPGRLSARLDLEGLMDAPESRIGSGRIRIEDARLADGGSVALLQLGQLMPPISNELATARAELWIDGGEVLLEDVALESDALVIMGDGRLRLDDWRWSLRLVPRGTLPGLSDLVSAVSGSLAVIDVGGTPGDPEISVTPLPMVLPPPDIEPMNQNPEDPSVGSDAPSQESDP